MPDVHFVGWYASKQDWTYRRSYNGLQASGKHGGFISPGWWFRASMSVSRDPNTEGVEAFNSVRKTLSHTTQVR